MARQERVQVRRPNLQELIQPTPIQSDTFRGAQRRSGVGDNYFALADALGSFSASLGALAQEQKKKEGPQMENLFSRLTSKQRAQVARTGVLPDGTKIGDRPGLMKAAGRADFYNWRREIMGEMRTQVDWESEDVDAWIAQRANEYLDESGISDPFARKGFLDGVNSFRSESMGTQESFVRKREDAYESDIVYKNMEGMVYDLLEEGTAPDALHKAVRASYKDFGKEGSIGMNYERLDQYVLSIAANIVDEYPEQALALIESKRDGAGPASAPLADKVKYKSQVQGIRQAAANSITTRNADLAEQKVHQDNAVGLLEGDYTALERIEIEEGDDSPRVITREQQEERLTGAMLQWGEMQMEENKMSQRSVDREVVPRMMKKGLKHPFLEDEVDGIETRISAGTLADQTQLEDITERITRFRDMKAMSPSYVSSHLSDDTKEYLNAVDNLIRYKRLDLPRAVLMASDAFNADPALKSSLAYNRPEIREAVEDHMDDYLLTNSTNYDEYNIGDAVARVEAYAGTLYATGQYTQEEAIEQSAKEVSRATPRYKGQIINGLEKYPIAPNWQEGVDLIIERFRGQVSPAYTDEEMFIRHQGGGRFYISTIEGEPILNKNGKPIATNVWEINEMSAVVGEEGMDEIIEGNKELQRKRDELRRVYPHDRMFGR